MIDYKVENGQLKVTETTSEVKDNLYDPAFLVKQRDMIVKDANDYLAKRKVEISDLDILIAKCDELGVKPVIITEQIK